MTIESTPASPTVSAEALRFWQQVAAESGVPIEGLAFMYDAFDSTQRSVASKPGEVNSRRRHCTPAQYCESFVRFAQEKFGADYITALHSWGLDTSENLGNALYYLISRNLFGTQASDRQSDFDGQFDFASGSTTATDSPVYHYSAEHLPQIFFAQQSLLRSRPFRILLNVAIFCAIIEGAAAIAEYAGPNWFPIIVSAMILAFVTIRSLPYPYRFSLRALLTVMTLVALGLGLIALLIK